MSRSNDAGTVIGGCDVEITHQQSNLAISNKTDRLVNGGSGHHVAGCLGENPRKQGENGLFIIHNQNGLLATVVIIVHLRGPREKYRCTDTCRTLVIPNR